MKNQISLITGSDLRMVMGVNYFLKSFVQCNEFFKEIEVNRVYSECQTQKVDEGEQIPIGSDLGTSEYKFRRGIRTLLRKVLSSKFYPFALFRYMFNLRMASKKSICRFMKDNAPCDYILFQELGVAEYYFKHCMNNPKTRSIKTMLVIHSEDDSGNMLLEKFKGYGRKDMQRRLYKMRDFVYERIDKVMYISRKAYDSSILPIGKRSFVYNGSPDMPLCFGGRNDAKIQFVCVGSIEGRKGQDKIIEAMKLMDIIHLKKMHMTFVGGGSKEDEIKKMVHDYSLDNYVTFLGRRNDVPDILKGMDVFIMPSTVEGLPMSAIEAMRAGLYLILTDTGGNAELCEKNCGSICSREPSDIVAKIYAVLGNGVVCIEQKQRSYNRFVEHFSLESMARGYEKILKSL